ncbi:MAG: sigma-70 family RNA polymerase sigma factor [Clostridia bacterium]|nr:sigma-70 family RNA polymerase sigma factor [Clostridia bacterium]
MNSQNETDETLVMLTLAGDQDAYGVLVSRGQKAVNAAAHNVTKNHFMAQDAAQDAFVSAWMKLDTLREPEKFCSWVCRIAANCARNMIARYRSYLPLEAAEGQLNPEDPSLDPAELCARKEEQSEVGKSLLKLPEKVKKIIYLHYYRDLSIPEIAERMRVSEGTVKRQLHDGRKRLRKELCAMDEKYTDTLVQRVLKKVEELKLWQVRNSKKGFEKEYKQVLKEVEELPECKEKSSALADVLMRGWWWLPGKKNDALFARIAEAALESKNEEVMCFVVGREDSKVAEKARAEFIKTKQIPRLEKEGFTKALGTEWFWLGYYLFSDGKAEEGGAAYKKAAEILAPGEPLRYLAPRAVKLHKRLSEHYEKTPKNKYITGASASEYRFIDGELRFWSEESVFEGWLESVDRDLTAVVRGSSLCDGRFFADIPVGESVEGSDSTTLKHISDSETVDTPAGNFSGCSLWETRRLDRSGKSVTLCWYKEGVGIVKREHSDGAAVDARVLGSYTIRGGNGLLPVCAGNEWTFVAEKPSLLEVQLSVSVDHADGEKVIFTSSFDVERLGFDGDLWAEAAQRIADDYFTLHSNDSEELKDVSEAIALAEKLASTPLEKAHTAAAASVARRLLETDALLNPGRIATGHWNFFDRILVVKKEGLTDLTEYNCRWSFEWKDGSGLGAAEEPILFNDVYGILRDAANCVWSDEWFVGASPVVEYSGYSGEIKTKITCSDGGTVETKAGRFNKCLKLSLDVSGMSVGLFYRGGRKTYYFAEGIGIVRTENEYCGGAKTAVYELTSFKGTGEGYMPFDDGLVRRYDAIGLTDGFTAWAEYTCVRDADGDIVIVADRAGIRVLPPPITSYGAIEGEIIEDRLWYEKKRAESRLRHDVNNFNLLCHFLGRPSRYWAAPEKAAAWNKYRLRILEGLDFSGKVPDAWLGFYASTLFRTACALFGSGKKDEGYEYLEKAFEEFPKWDAIPDGEEMDTGEPLIYGGVKVIKEKNIIKLPDGTLEPLYDVFLFDDTSSLLYHGMTAPHGWEWFDPVRKEERFKEYIERAKKLSGK